MALGRVQWQALLLFIYGVFKNAVKSSEYMSSNDEMVNGKWIGKNVLKSGCDNLKCYLRINLEGWSKTTENLS
jgi:hypothetical protein